jgi:peptide deformylase
MSKSRAAKPRSIPRNAGKDHKPKSESGRDEHRQTTIAALRDADLDEFIIVRFPHPSLRKLCRPVTEFGPQLRSLANRMLTLMREFNGVGLAAPQIGLSWRIFVCNATGEPKDDLVCVNPTFLELSGQTESAEGCLSLPGVNVTVRRAGHAVLRASTADGEPFELVSDDLPARIWQHETDHLDGRLIIDRMSSTDEIANRKAIRQLEAEFKAARR